MKTWKAYTGGIIIMVMLAVLFTTSYDGVKEYYGFRETYTQDLNGTQMTITEGIAELEVVEAINNFQKGAQSALSLSSAFDILGGIALTAFGALRFLFGLITLPLEMIGIMTKFYIIPDVLAWGIGAAVITYFFFIFINFKRGSGEI